MTEPNLSPSDPLDGATTAVLQMSIIRGQRAIDRLLDLLAARLSPETDTFGMLLHKEGWPSDLPPPHAIARSSPGVAMLIRMKDSGKRLAADAGNDLERMQGAARYALAAAAALAHHGVCISSLDREELHPLLLDFAELTAAPWSGLFKVAARACVSGTRDENESEARDG